MIKTVLIVDDDNSIREYLKEAFVRLDFKVYTAQDGIAAIDEASKRQPDIILLDLELPKINGDTVCKEVKSRFPEIPVIMLTVKDSSSDVVHGFSMGADDYIIKPFDLDELVARVNSRIRVPDGGEYYLQDIVIDDSQKKVRVAEKSIKLTPREYLLLYYLVTNKDRVLSRDLILNRVWSDKEFIEPRVVDVYIGYLRKKLDQDNLNKYIRTVRGFGYQVRA